MAAVFLYGTTSPAAPPESPPTPEHRAKAAFLHNLLRFVTWPEGAHGSADTPLTVRVLGPDTHPFALALAERVAGRPVRGREVRVQSTPVPGPERVAEAPGAECHVLYVPADLPGETVPLVAPAGRPLLTVGERPGFTGEGGMVRLFLKDGRVRFDVDLDAAERAGLVVSSKLLALASTVRGGER